MVYLKEKRVSFISFWVLSWVFWKIIWQCLCFLNLVMIFQSSSLFAFPLLLWLSSLLLASLSSSIRFPILLPLYQKMIPLLRFLFSLVMLFSFPFVFFWSVNYLQTIFFTLRLRLRHFDILFLLCSTCIPLFLVDFVSFFLLIDLLDLILLLLLFLG